MRLNTVTWGSFRFCKLRSFQSKEAPIFCGWTYRECFHLDGPGHHPQVGGEPHAVRRGVDDRVRVPPRARRLVLCPLAAILDAEHEALGAHRRLERAPFGEERSLIPSPKCYIPSAEHRHDCPI